MSEEPISPPESDGGRTEPEPASEPGKSYTQEELDRIVAQRVQKSKSQFKDYEQYKQAAQKLAEIEAANQTESEKLRATAEQARQEAQQATEREQQAIERARNTLVRAAVVSEASRQQAVDPDAVFALLDKSQLTIGDDDQVLGVSEAVQGLLSERAYLVGRPHSSGFDGGARSTASEPSSQVQLNDEIRRLAGFK